MKRICLISLLLGLGIIYAYPQDSIVSIPDVEFLYALIKEGVDTNGDSLISFAEAEALTSLDVGGFKLPDGFSVMTGIEAFINLNVLMCGTNPLTSLNVSNNTALTELYCPENQLTSLDVSNNTALTVLYCPENQLTSLDVSTNTALRALYCPENQLTSLDVSNNNALEDLYCYDNQLTSLDVSNNTALWELRCNNNQLTSLDVSNNTALGGLSCGGNLLSSLDLSKNTALGHLGIRDMPTLEQVCVWWTPFLSTRVVVSITGSPNAYLTTDCTIGIEETNLSELTIYPNPTSSLLTIETEYPDHYSIEITSLNGKQIFTEEMEGNTHQIDLSSFQKGVYFITIRSKDFVTTRKIIKL